MPKEHKDDDGEEDDDSAITEVWEDNGEDFTDVEGEDDDSASPETSEKTATKPSPTSEKKMPTTPADIWE